MNQCFKKHIGDGSDENSDSWLKMVQLWLNQHVVKVA